MRKVILNMKELEKYQIIKKFVESNGNKKSASIKIGCSIKTINRLINTFAGLAIKDVLRDTLRIPRSTR